MYDDNYIKVFIKGKYNVKSKEDVIEEIKRKLGKNSAREDDDIVATSTIVLKLTCPVSYFNINK